PALRHSFDGGCRDVADLQGIALARELTAGSRFAGLGMRSTGPRAAIEIRTAARELGDGLPDVVVAGRLRRSRLASVLCILRGARVSRCPLGGESIGSCGFDSVFIGAGINRCF